MPHDQYGREIPDPRPVELPTGLKVRPSLQEEIRRYIRAEMSNHARDQGWESFEEANDFDIDDDIDAMIEQSPYALHEMRAEPGDVDASASQLRAPNGPSGPSIRPEPPPAEGSQEPAK